MNKSNGISILLMVFFLQGGKGRCTIQDQIDCEAYVYCTHGLENLDPEALRVERDCSNNHGWNWHNYWRIFLNISHVNIDWADWNNVKKERIIGIALNDIDEIPIIIEEFKNLEKLAIVNIHARELIWYSLCVLNHLNKLSITHGNIEIINNFLNEKQSHLKFVDLSYNLIEALSNNCFPNFSQLKELNLSHNLIQTIDAHSVEGMTSLEIFDISYNRLIEIEHSFVNFVNIKKLYLNNNNLTSIIGPNFRSMNKMETLNISSNQLNIIEDDAFRVLVNLEELDLSNNKLTNISKVLFWSNLKMHRLLLTNNNICTIETEAFKMKNITSFEFDGNKLKGAVQKRSFDGIYTDDLNLSGGQITSLEPEAFTGLQTRVLNVSCNILTTISATSFKSFTTNYLDLSYNNLSIIDFETEDMKQLILFTARNNKITKVSKSTLINCVSLLTLDLSHNKISELEPQSFDKLITLQFLDLSHNLLANSLSAIFFHGLSGIINLQLEHNRFTSIENNTFSGLKSLKILNCAHGEISRMEHDSFKDTGSLEILDLSNNMLNDFFINLVSIRLLKELYLNDNYIQNITMDMFIGLKYLEKLNLANNNVIKFNTESFNSLNNLKSLDLSFNTALNIKNVLMKTVNYLVELKFTNIKTEIDFENIVNKSISRLDISHNDIANINTVYIFKINDIEYLNLRANKITFIDKYSFQKMLILKELDLSSNSINFIQPGSFLHVNKIQTLNLHGNSLPALQFGVLDGMYDLETLNISNNAIHKFEKSLLFNTPKISTIALDNNAIEEIKFDSFVQSAVKLITIGGNPISCHALSYFINYGRMALHAVTVTAVNLDYHNENVNGISCISYSIPKQNYSLSQNNTPVNETPTFWILNKAIENIHASIKNFQAAVDKINFRNKSEENQSALETIININNDTNYHISLIEQYLKRNAISENIQTNSEKGNNIEDANFLDNVLQNKLKTMNDQKDKMVREMQAVVDSFKKGHVINSAQVNEMTANSNLISVLYFVAICLTILIVFHTSKYVLTFWKFKIMQKNTTTLGSTHQMANIIELQDT